MCVRGASALQDVLKDAPAAGTRVFVVWEPVLPTDIAPPTSRDMARVPDRRVAQYWDKSRVLSAEFWRTKKEHPERDRLTFGDFVESIGIVWDVVAVFGPDAEWTDMLPVPSYFGGPVVHIDAEMRAAIGAKGDGKAETVTH
jgi:hypothetical protein